MISFSLWDILRNLLLAGRWTVVLSLVTFLLGGMLGLLILFMRTSQQGLLRGAHEQDQQTQHAAQQEGDK